MYYCKLDKRAKEALRTKSHWRNVPKLLLKASLTRGLVVPVTRFRLGKPDEGPVGFEMSSGIIELACDILFPYWNRVLSSMTCG
jgi:hypothetical protein